MLLLGVGVLLRLLYTVHRKFNSDEPQHLHVVWGWTHGLLQYRDVFDNHGPLFHLLMMPVLAVVGERPEALILMRFAMLPLLGAALAGLYYMGQALYDGEVAIWSLAITALLPPFYSCCVEFRADLLWMTCWLLALTVLVRGKLTMDRCWLAGILLGGALCVSLKTVVLLASLSAAAAIVVLPVLRTNKGAAHVRHWGCCGAALFAGTLALPSIITMSFWARGALRPFLYGTVLHNTGLEVLQPQGFHLPLLVVPLLLLTIWRLSSVLGRAAPTAALALRRRALIWTWGLAYVAFHTLWPIVTAQDELPLYPLLILCVTPLLFGFPPAGPPEGSLRRSVRAKQIAFALVLVELFLLARDAPWRNGTESRLRNLREILRLTDPTDTVMDAKGEAVFRRRPYYYVLETLTLRRLQLGLLKDDIPEHLVANGTCVAVGNLQLFPKRARAFIERNYLRVGHLWVAGTRLPAVEPGRASVSFMTVIPASYAVVPPPKADGGTLDGTPYTGGRYLSPGPHTFQPRGRVGHLAVIWQQVADRGFAPDMGDHMSRP